MEELPYLVLRQSNKEFLTEKTAQIFAPIIQNLINANIKIKQQVPNLDFYKLTCEKLASVEDIKMIVTNKVEEKLKVLHNYYQQNKVQIQQDPTKYRVLIKQMLGVEYYDITDFPDSIKNIITELPYKKPNGNAMNNFIKKTLQNEINLYLEQGFIDKPKQGTNIQNSIFLKDALEVAQAKQYVVITNCNSAMLQNANHNQESAEKTRNDFALFLSVALKKNLKLPESRKTLKATYTDSSSIESTTDLYAKEHLSYRSAIRQSRNNTSKQISRLITFDDNQDLTVQKFQDIKSQSAITPNHISSRGTIQEEVYNLGNYEKVLTKIEEILLIGGIKFDEPTAAKILRAVYKEGIKGLSTLTYKFDKVNNAPLSQYMTKEQKQTVIELVELFFGTEAFRSPAAIVETNMAFDLIISGAKTWSQLLVGKGTVGKGGELSFSMKSSEGAGGIELGRQLSEGVNPHHSRMHKYGGEPIGKDSRGYQEYLSRKKDMVDSWVEKVGKKDPKTLSPIQKAEMIRARDNDWYNGM